MFTKKVSKPQSTSKLLKLLTHRSSLKKISVKRGLYEQWPAQEKPSLFNCSTNYIKYLSNCNSQHKQDEPTKEKHKKNTSISKQPATFSTCTTMEFYPTTHQNTQFFSKFTTTPKSIELHQCPQGQTKQFKFTPYMTPLEDASQILDESQSHLKHVSEEDYEGKLNSKYNRKHNERPITFNFQKKSVIPERRLIKTAKINRQMLHTQDSNEEQCNQSNHKKYSSGPLTPSRSVSSKNPAFTKIGYIRGNSNGMSTPTLRSNSSKQSLCINYDYPMRLKDYETNFQAYKVISELIDQQMKWEPKRVRPKSSVLFRKYNVGVKV